jgi:hypothetical protein
MTTMTTTKQSNDNNDNNKNNQLTTMGKTTTTMAKIIHVSTKLCY